MTAKRSKTRSSVRRGSVKVDGNRAARAHGRGADRPGRSEPTPWERLAGAVAEAIAVLTPGQCLVLSAKRRGYWVHLVAGGHGGVHAEATSNAWLKARDILDEEKVARLRELGWAEPTATREEVEASDETLDRSSNFTRDWRGPAPLPEVAAVAVATLRDVYGMRRTNQLEYTAFGPGPKEILLPTLGLDNAPLPEETHEHDDEQLVQPENREELRLAVTDALRSFTDLDEVSEDEDGDIPLRYGGALIFLRVAGDAPYVELFSPLLSGVEPSLELYKALNELTGHHRQIGFFFTGGIVFASLDLLADPFVPDHLGGALAVLGRLCDETGHDLQQRFGGSTAFEEAARQPGKRRKARYN